MLLDKLQGTWIMTGTVMKKPVHYSAEGAWTLQNEFFSFHMKDTTPPPTYEATLFIGLDTSKNQYVAHWLDSFGGAGARVVGFGPLSSEKIEIVYPYAEGAFRNLFTFDSGKDEWDLLIESQDKDGTWSTFAQFKSVREKLPSSY